MERKTVKLELLVRGLGFDKEKYSLYLNCNVNKHIRSQSLVTSLGKHLTLSFCTETDLFCLDLRLDSQNVHLPVSFLTLLCNFPQVMQGVHRVMRIIGN